MSASEECQHDHIALYIAMSLFALAALVYTIQNAFKCYFRCRKRGTKQEAVFKAGFRGDDTSSNSTASPQRQDSDPATPPTMEDPLLETV